MVKYRSGPDFLGSGGERKMEMKVVNFYMGVGGELLRN